MSGSRQIFARRAQHFSPWKGTTIRPQSFFPWSLNPLRTSSSLGFRDYATSTQTTRAAHSNPGNFANRSKEELREIGQKGGRATGVGGFHDMDPEKQVSVATCFLWGDSKVDMIL